MKTLTIRSPWAELIIDGYKEYEFRSWKTNYRGKILIHAGINVEKAYLDRFKGYNLNIIKGAIIGEAELIDCILVDNKFNKKLYDKDNKVYGMNDHSNKYAWQLINVKKYDEPIYVKGKLGLWNYNI